METDNGTTQLDVTTAVEAAAGNQDQAPALSPRELAIAAIDQQVELARQQQQEEYQQQMEPQTTAAPAPVPQADQAGVRLLKVKVDGEEMEVPESQVVESFQKISAADRKMKDAAEEWKRIEREKQELEEQKKALGTMPSVDNDSNLPDTDGSDLSAQANLIISSLLEGNTADAVHALTEVLSKSSKPTASEVDESKVAEIVQKVSSQQELDRDYVKAKQLFDQDYGFINDNPRLAMLANGIFSEHLAAGKMPSEAAKLAGEEVKGLMAPPVQPSAMQQRQERKGAIDTITPASGVTPQSSVDAVAKADPNSVIAEMKRQRGQT